MDSICSSQITSPPVEQMEVPQDPLRVTTMLRVTKRVLEKLVLSHEEKKMTLRHFLLKRVAESPFKEKDFLSSLKLFTLLEDILNSKGIQVDSNHQVVDPLIVLLTKQSEMLDFSIESLVHASSSEVLEKVDIDPKDFSTVLCLLLKQVNINLSKFTHYCSDQANCMTNNLSQTKKQKKDEQLRMGGGRRYKGTRVQCDETKITLSNEDKLRLFIKKLKRLPTEIMAKLEKVCDNLSLHQQSSLSVQEQEKVTIKNLVVLENLTAKFESISQLVHGFREDIDQVSQAVKVERSLQRSLQRSLLDLTKAELFLQTVSDNLKLMSGAVSLSKQIGEEEILSEKINDQTPETKLSVLEQLFLPGKCSFAECGEKIKTASESEKFCTQTEMVLRVVEGLFQDICDTLTEYKNAVTPFLRVLLKHSLDIVLLHDQRTPKALYLSKTPWVELVDEETTIQKTNQLSPVIVTKQTGKKNPKKTIQAEVKEEEEVEMVSSLPLQSLSGLVKEHILGHVKDFTSNEPYQRVSQKDECFAKKLLHNYRYHLSQIFLAYDWSQQLKTVHEKELQSLAAVQLLFSLSNALEMATHLLYFDRFGKSPSIHSHRRTMDELKVWDRLEASEREFILGIDRASVWMRYPSSMSENYQKEKPFFLQLVLDVSSLDSVTHHFSSEDIKHWINRTFSILNKLLSSMDRSSSVASSEILNQIEASPKIEISPSTSNPVVEKQCNAMIDFLSSQESHPVYCREIIGYLHRLQRVFKLAGTVSIQHHSMILRELALLSYAVEGMLRLLSLKKTGEIVFSHDFLDSFSLLGDEFRSFEMEAMKYSLGRGYYMPAFYSQFPLAKALLRVGENGMNYLGVEEGFMLQNHSESLSPWFTWAKEGINYLSKLVAKWENQ
jgi:hypothetical protein